MTLIKSKILITKNIYYRRFYSKVSNMITRLKYCVRLKYQIISAQNYYSLEMILILKIFNMTPNYLAKFGRRHRSLRNSYFTSDRL